MREARALLAPLVLRPARKDLLRFALTAAGVAVGVATVAAIRLANQSVLSSFANTVDAVAGKARLTVLADGPGIPEETLARLAWLGRDGIRAVPAVTATAATLATAANAGTAATPATPATSGPSTAGDAGDVVEVLGIDPLSDDAVRDYVFAASRQAERGGNGEGAAPGAGASFRRLFELFGPNTLLVTEAFAARHRLGPDGTLRLVASGREVAMKVVAVLRPVGPARAAGGGIVVADLATVQEAFGKVGRLDRIDLVFPEDSPEELVARVSEEVAASLGPGLSVGPPERRAETVDRMVRAFRVNLAALGLIALLVGVFFVYNTLSISVLRRRTEIGTVRALGASRRAVFLAFLAEGAALGAAGSFAGILLGALLARGALLLVGGTATDFYLPSARPEFRLDGAILLGAFATGVVASVLSALAPALEAASVPPAASMRHGSVEASRRRATLPLALAGLVLLALGGAATRPGPVGGLPLFGFLSVFLLVSGAALLAPSAVTSAARLLDPLATRILGVPARIGAANLTGSLSRTAVAVAALTMGVSMMVAVAVMVGSFRDTVVRWIDQTLAADLFVSPASGRSGVSFGRLPEEAVRLVESLPGVASADPFLSFAATRDGAPYSVGSGRFAEIARRGNLPLVDGSDPRPLLAEAKEKGWAMVSDPYAEKFGVRAGDEVTLPAPGGPARFRVAGVYVDYSSDRGTVTLDRELFERTFAMDGAVSIALFLAPGVPVEEGRRAVSAALGAAGYAVRVRSNAQLRRDAVALFDRTFAVTWALEAVAIAVAVLGVFGTLVALVLERRREVALLRVLGASAAQVRAAVRFEAFAIGALGTALGLLAGGAMSWVLVHVVNRQSFGWTIATHVPWGFLAASSGLVLAATILASLHPARLAAATDPAAVLKEE